MRLVRRFLFLPWREKLLVARASTTLLYVKMQLRSKEFRELRAAVDQKTQALRGSPVGAREKQNGDWQPAREQILWAVDVGSRYIPASLTCLPRAISAELLLAKYGYPSEFKIGVGRDENGTFMAHAWLEWEGKVLIGGADSPIKYTKLPPIETKSAEMNNETMSR